MKIEKNIPIPDKRSSEGNRWVDLAKQMEVGDSVLVTSISGRSAITAALKSNGYTQISRLITKDPMQIRVWRQS